MVRDPEGVSPHTLQAKSLLSMAYSRGSGYHLPGKGLRRRIFQEKDLSDEFSHNAGLSLCLFFDLFSLCAKRG